MIHMSDRLKLVETGYNKAIDDFVNDCKKDILCQTLGLDINRIKYIAEKLKRRNRIRSI